MRLTEKEKIIIISLLEHEKEYYDNEIINITDTIKNARTKDNIKTNKSILKDYERDVKQLSKTIQKFYKSLNR
jgi:hypothetical protein